MKRPVEIIGEMHARVPVDRVAAWVTGPGEHFTPRNKVLTNDSEFPIETRHPTVGERNTNGFIDLTGRRVGRFTVIGVARHFAAQWVVRCDCGRYSTRRAKAIKNAENTQDRCEHCRYLASLKRSELWRRTGRSANIRDF